MVGGNTVHVDRLLRNAAKEIAASDNNPNLAAKRMYPCYLLSNLVDKNGVNAETSACGQGFAGELKQDSFVHVRL
jgi:hypothetical protein